MLLVLHWPLNPGKLWPQNEEAVTVLLLESHGVGSHPDHHTRRKLMACDRNHVNILYTYGLGRVFLKHEHAKEVCTKDMLPFCNAAGKQAVETI